MTKLTTQRPAWRACAGLLLVAFTVTTCPGFGWVPTALADGAADLEQARYHFDFGEYDQAEALLTGAIDGGELSGESLRDAYVLRARCALAQGQDAAARDDFCEVVRLDDAWRPDPVEFTQGEVAGFEAVRADCAPAPAPVVAPPPAEEEEKGKGFFAKPIGWIVTGVVVVGGVILATGGGGDDGGGDAQPTTLPPPPPPPAK